ncbi:hypothetical protein [Paenirhodobacter populi]|uniref:Uncharacterized protein n=1 Tax=Paenirhodobacter populi TaxID=2306993 RepID=A0A443ITI2_9RHOB|nr:hypothetical protein [Sinirhodobacter populi]RWR11008.1 hypothetical protein D2T33_11775 [Sinirhodobacter populi]
MKLVRRKGNPVRHGKAAAVLAVDHGAQIPAGGRETHDDLPPDQLVRDQPGRMPTRLIPTPVDGTPRAGAASSMFMRGDPGNPRRRRDGRSLRRISVMRPIESAVFDFNAQPREGLSGILLQIENSHFYATHLAAKMSRAETTNPLPYWRR